MTLQTYVTHLCQHCGLAEEDIEVTVDEAEEAIQVQLNVPQEDVGLFIGHHGEAISSIQRLLRITFRDDFPEKVIRLNINDYREERVEQLKEKAREVGQMVLESGEEYIFPFMSSYERFVIHTTISEEAEFEGLESASEGEGKNRRLVVRKV